MKQKLTNEQIRFYNKLVMSRNAVNTRSGKTRKQGKQLKSHSWRYAIANLISRSDHEMENLRDYYPEIFI